MDLDKSLVDSKRNLITILIIFLAYQCTADSFNKHLLSVHSKTGLKGYANFQVKKTSFNYLPYRTLIESIEAEQIP